MLTHFRSILSRPALQVLALGVLAVVGSFGLGVSSAGEVQPITLIQAGSIQSAGDLDGDGVVGIQDVILILEIAQGYRTADPQQMRADPNGDGLITVNDAIRILHQLR